MKKTIEYFKNVTKRDLIFALIGTIIASLFMKLDVEIILFPCLILGGIIAGISKERFLSNYIFYFIAILLIQFIDLIPEWWK